MSKLQKRWLVALISILVLILFGNFFYSIYAKMIDKSSYTDWISAFCNVVMAGATVGAVITARNYLAQFTAQEGYKIAIELVNDFFPRITQLDFEKTIDKLTHFDELKTDIFKNHDFSDVLYIMQGQVKFLADRRNSIKLYGEKLSEYLYKVNTYGLTPGYDMSKHVGNIRWNINKLLLSLDESILLMSKCHSLGSELHPIWWVRDDEVEKKKHGKMLMASFNDINLKEHRSIVVSSIENINNDYEKFVNIGHSITKLFIVK